MAHQVVWLTGLSGAGKTTLCNSVAERLRFLSHPVQVLDGDEMRKGLCADLGFSQEDRAENLRRIAHVAALMAKDPAIVLVAVISPLRSMRAAARKIVTEANACFCEVYVNAPLEVCEERDVKGLYRRARGGEISNFTGVGSGYEPPLSPDVVCETAIETIAESTDKVLSAILHAETGPAQDTSIEQVRRRTLAVDFDGVLAEYDGWQGRNVLGQPRRDVVNALRALAAEGWKIVVHTTRHPADIVEHLQAFSIPFDEINRNPAYANTGSKPAATVYWDDRALRYSGDAAQDLDLIRSFRTWSGRL